MCDKIMDALPMALLFAFIVFGWRSACWVIATLLGWC